MVFFSFFQSKSPVEFLPIDTAKNYDASQEKQYHLKSLILSNQNFMYIHMKIRMYISHKILLISKSLIHGLTLFYVFRICSWREKVQNESDRKVIGTGVETNIWGKKNMTSYTLNTYTLTVFKLRSAIFCAPLGARI